jgi:hypothetical protein
MLLKVDVIQVFCSRLNFINWLQNHLIPCPFKYLTGLDCPGCGFQRSMLALIHGDLHKSVALYPAAIPLISLSIYLIFDKYFKLDNSKNIVKKTLFMIVGGIILTSYCIKMWGLFSHYKASA